MIEKLKKEDINEAAKVYQKGLQMEIPKGYSSFEETIKKLKERKVFIYKENNKIKGLISFSPKPQGKIRIDFICVINLRKGIGKKLMKKLADFAIKNNINLIYTNMSFKDKRAMNFYKSCGFRKFGKYKSYQNLTLYRIKAKPELIKKQTKS